MDLELFVFFDQSLVIHHGIAISKFDFEHSSVIYFRGFGTLCLRRLEIANRKSSSKIRCNRGHRGKATFFLDINWDMLARQKAMFIPSAEALDTSYFMSHYVWNPEDENVGGDSDFDDMTKTWG